MIRFHFVLTGRLDKVHEINVRSRERGRHIYIRTESSLCSYQSYIGLWDPLELFDFRHPICFLFFHVSTLSFYRRARTRVS